MGFTLVPPTEMAAANFIQEDTQAGRYNTRLVEANTDRAAKLGRNDMASLLAHFLPIETPRMYF